MRGLSEDENESELNVHTYIFCLPAYKKHLHLYTCTYKDKIQYGTKTFYREPGLRVGSPSQVIEGGGGGGLSIQNILDIHILPMQRSILKLAIWRWDIHIDTKFQIV